MNASASTLGSLTPAARSAFVTVLAWILIVFCALGLLSAVTQMTAIGTLPRLSGAQDPALAESIGGFFRGVAAVNIALMAFFTYAAYALLQRHNWARRTFVVLFALGLAANIVSIIVFGLGSWFAGSLFSTLAQGQGDDVGGVFTAIFVFGLVLAILMSLLLGWLIKRLRSAAVKREFDAQS
jgi:hypothetical protein